MSNDNKKHAHNAWIFGTIVALITTRVMIAQAAFRYA